MHAGRRAVNRAITSIVFTILRLFLRNSFVRSFVRSFIRQIIWHNGRSIPVFFDSAQLLPPFSASSPMFYFYVLRNVRESGLTLSRETMLSRKKHGVRADTEIVKGHGSFAFTVGSYDKSCDCRARDCCIKFRPTRGRRGVIPGDTPRLTTSIREADLLS